MEEANSKEVDSKNGLSIPGLPDPAAILKLAEVLRSAGQEILPIFVQGNSAGDFVVQRLDKDVKFVKDMKNEIDTIRKKLKI